MTSSFTRGATAIGLAAASLVLAVGVPAGATTTTTAPTSAPASTTPTTAAPAPVASTPAPATTVPDPRATGVRAAFAPKAPGALPRPIITRGVANDPLALAATDLLARLALGQTGAPVDEVRARVAAIAAARITTATAAELDAAWARTTPTRLKVVLTALAQIGVRYQWAGATPAGGFDCSGLVLFAWAAVGVKLPHQSEEQLAAARAVTQAQLQPGDVTHYPNHVGVYLGAGRAIVHAVQTGVPVKVDDWSTSVRSFGSFLPA